VGGPDVSGLSRSQRVWVLHRPASAIKKGENVLALGTVNGTTITASQVIAQPTGGGGSATSSTTKAIPFQPGAPSTSKQVGQIPANYSQGSGTIVLMPSLLTLSDVMGTGHHAAVTANVGPGKVAAVVGDGAVGLCGVIAAKRLGAERVILLGRHPNRIALAREFGATDVVSERGEEAVEHVRELTDGYGVHAVLECVGLEQSELTAIQIARPGGAVGRVGVPQDETMPASQPAFYNNISVSGGPAPVRAYIEELLPDILEGSIEPGRVFDRVIGFDDVPDGYRAMNDRNAIKVMVTP
jgi:threonine dehydrogenase-like Zn-dependent dehydrogenase